MMEDLHTWSEEEQECLVKGEQGTAPHSHFMKCSICGIKRYGAFSEPGCYHYFLYDSGWGEEIPPCIKPTHSSNGTDQ